MKKLLFFQWASFMNRGIEKALQKLNVAYEVFFYQFQDWEADEKFCRLFYEKLENGKYNRVLSVNFAPLISNICERMGIPYVSWVYDSPVHIRNLEPMNNSCNTIYFFDRGQAEAYKKKGIGAAMHLPLAVDPDLMHQAVSAGKAMPSMDISMVGNLYQNEYSYMTSPLGEYVKGYLEGVVNGQLKVYGGYLIPDLVTEDLLDKMNAEYRAVSDYQISREELEFLLANEVTRRERFIALALLSDHYDVSVYTKKEDENLRNVRFGGYADYETMMPKIFASSRINLNCTLKTIRSGIPLRVLDIAGCGGFVMSNYQIELAEYFHIGDECEVYQDLEDLALKTEFYLRNEELRKKIAQAGLERVKRDFSFEERIRVLLK